MSINSSALRFAARYLLLRLAAFANGLAERLLNGAVRIKGGRRLSIRQREFLLRDFRLELESAVEDAERHAISDEDANRISLIRLLVRWLENGESPGPEVIPHLERQLEGIHRRPDPHEVTERKALIAAIHVLGGNDRAAAGIWRKPDPEISRGLGRTLHRQMRRVGLTVSELAERANLEPSEVVAYLYGTEQPKAEELLKLAGAVGVEAEVLLKGAAFGEGERPGLDAGLNQDRPAGDDGSVNP